MKKYVFLLSLLLTACAASPNDSQTAECSQLSGRIIQAPKDTRQTGGNFLTQYREQMNTESARQHAQAVHCR